MIAACYRSGEIEIFGGKKAPRGSIEISRGSRAELVRACAGVARLAYENKTWLVPGIPEADSDAAAEAALAAFMPRFRRAVLAARYPAPVVMTGPNLAPAGRRS